MASEHAGLSLATPEAMTCPFSIYDRMREESPAYKDAFTGAYVVTRYQDLQQVMADTEAFSSRLEMEGLRGEIARTAEQMSIDAGLERAEVLVASDPPRHKRQRSLVDKVFSQRRVREMEPDIVAVTEKLISAFPEGAFDFHDAFAMPLPMRIIADQLGLSHDMYDDFKRWSDAAVNLADPARTDDEHLQDTRDSNEMRLFFIAQVKAARDDPSDNLLSALANTHTDEGDMLGENELSMLLQILLAAGNETTTHAIASAALRLAEDLELQQSLRGNPALIPTFVEEVLRLDAPLQGLFRQTTKDTHIGEVPVPAGSLINIRMAAGNRDPRQFECPADLDLKRGRTGHLTFGYGIHHCIGSQLARAELRLSLERLLAGSREIVLAQLDEAVVRRPHFLAYGPRRLMLEYRRA